jgi:hypothetical protein
MTDPRKRPSSKVHLLDKGLKGVGVLPWIVVAAAPLVAQPAPQQSVCGNPGPAPGISVEKHERSYRVAIPGMQGRLKTGQSSDLMLSGFGFDRSGGALQLRYNSGITSDGKRLIVADRGNNRVLVWNALPEGNTPPDVVLGQKDFEANFEGNGLGEMNWPLSVATDGTRLVVADAYNDRLLIWNEFPAANGQPADMAIHIRWPWGVWTNGQKLVATSTVGGTAAVWNHFPTRTDEEPSFRLRAGGNFGTPRGVTSNGEFLIIGDHNARVTEKGPGNYVWRKFPDSEDAPYDFFFTDPIDDGATWLQGDVLPDGTLAMLGRTLHFWPSLPEANRTAPALSVRRFAFAGGDASSLAHAAGRLYVSGANGNRILVYNSVPGTDIAPDFAIGSTSICANTLDLNSIVTNPVPSTNGASLFVTSDFDRKLYVWRHIPGEDNAQPDLVYTLPEGPWQNTLWEDTLIAAGRRSIYVWRGLPVDGRMPETLSEPIGGVRFQEIRGVAYDGERLFVSDAQANRVHVWKGIPTKDQAPEFSLGIEMPSRLSTDGKWLAVAATERQSVHLFRLDGLDAGSRPRTLGGFGGPGPGPRFNLPGHALLSNGKLFVADTVSNRIWVWASVEDALAGRQPEALLGLPQMQPSLRAEGLFWPGALAFDGYYLWAGEFKFSGRLRRYAAQ